MKGKHLVIGLVLFVVAVVVAIYFAMTATFNNYRPQQKMENTSNAIIESSESVV
jgi:hypothetical protein